MKQLLNDILDRLNTKVPALQYLDEDWGQLDFFSQHPPVKYPAGLVDISQATWSNVLKGGQTGLVQARLRLADMKLTNTSAKAPAPQRATAFAIYDIITDIHKALHNWAGSPHYSALMRMSTNRTRREDGLRIYEMIYSTQLNDASAMPQLATVILSPVITADPQTI